VIGILIAIMFFIFGCLCSWFWMDGKVKSMQTRLEHEQNLRIHIVDQHNKAYDKILSKIRELEI